MNTTQLRYFLAVYDAGSYTTAAEALFTSRQTLSRAVAELEKETGAELFTRKGRGIEPTPFGIEAADIARTIMASASRLNSFASQMQERSMEEPFALAIAHGGMRGTLINPEALQEALTASQCKNVQEQLLHTDSCLSAVTSGLVDACLVLGRPDVPELICEFVGLLPVTVAVDSRSPLSRGKSLALHDLKGVSIAQPENLTFFYDRMTSLCQSCGYEAQWQYVEDDPKAYELFLRKGGCVFVHENSPLLDTERFPHLRNMTLEEATQLMFSVFYVYRKDKDTPLSRSVMHVVMEHLR